MQGSYPHWEFGAAVRDQTEFIWDQGSYNLIKCETRESGYGKGNNNVSENYVYVYKMKYKLMLICYEDKCQRLDSGHLSDEASFIFFTEPTKFSTVRINFYYLNTF